MLEGDHSGMERLAFEGGDSGGRVVGNTPRAPGPPVKPVAYQRMPEFCHMHPDLMGAAGSRTAFHEAGNLWIALAQGTDEAIAGEGGLPSPGEDSHLLPVFRVAANITADFPLWGRENTTYHGQVDALHAVAGKLLCQGDMCSVGLGSNHETTGVFIEAVNDPRPFDVADAG